jgi:hypothetical protein
MDVTLTPELEASLKELAHRRGVPIEEFVLGVLRDWVSHRTNGANTGDEWESLVLKAGTDCGVSLPDAAVSSEGLYE